MIAKEFLTSASEMNRQIHYKEIELESLRDLAGGISGCGFGEGKMSNQVQHLEDKNSRGDKKPRHFLGRELIR